MKKLYCAVMAVCLAVGILALAGCATTGGAAAPLSQADFRKIVEQEWKQYSSTIMNNQGLAWAALWDVNGVQLPPDSPMVMSTEDFRIGVDEPPTIKWISFAIGIIDTYVDHEFGFAYGNYSLEYTSLDGKEDTKFAGKYQTIFHRQPDGSW
jgi:hypothetical protein